MQWMFLVIICIGVCLEQAAAAPRSRMRRPKGLAMEDSTERRVEGTFTHEDERGVYFLSESDETGSKLLITTLEGDNVIYVLQLREEVTFLSVGEKSLLIFHYEEEGDEIYRVTPSQLFVVLNAVQEDSDFEIDLLRSHLPEVGEEEGLFDLSHIVDFPDELQMIVEAARTMGQRGMNGRRNAALRVLFMHALNVERLLSQDETVIASSKPISGFALAKNKEVNNFEGEFAFMQNTETCTTYSTTCPVGECPYPRSGNNCFGMCGRQCDCWEWACGDCCTHRGCIEHDDCCTRSGFWARVRCLAPIDFTCDGRYRC